MLRLKNFEHIGIVASDIERSLRFYTDLGLEMVKRRGEGRQAAATLRMGDAEINMFCNPDPIGGDELQRVHHFCLCMDAATIDDLIADLLGARIAVTDGPVKRSDGMAVFVRDPDGLRIELLVKD
jgi:catechol 2,3-dioxygenase-like lactoylglutathione lyase family enzyme